MRSLMGRVQRLEDDVPSDWSPAVRRWLGWPLTDAEHAQADAELARVDLNNTAGWSKEMKEWLGVA